MIRGLDLFRERFRAHGDSLVLIGGAACDEWFTRQGLNFRTTRDLDIVLLVEAVDPGFVAELRQFIDDGGYQIRQRSEGGPPVLYRFAKPSDTTYPHMLEIFCRAPEGISLGDDQTIVPVPLGEDSHSLSAILVDEPYYALIRDHSEVRDGIGFATATALIPLKGKAWLDLTARRAAGETVDSDDILKHRTDVFRLAATLAATPGPELAEPIRTDLIDFLGAFPEISEDWPAILAALKNTFGGGIAPATLISTLKTYFLLS